MATQQRRQFDAVCKHSRLCSQISALDIISYLFLLCNQSLTMMIMIGSAIYYARSRFAMRRTEFACISPAEDKWVSFLESRSLAMVKESYQMECCQPGSAIVDECSLLDLWVSTLEQACGAWTSIFVLGEDYDDAERVAMWEEVCFLLKGVFYLANDIPLKAIEMELPNEFVLHAAAFALPLCDKSNTDEHLRRVFKSVMDVYSDQAAEAGPVLGRFPLHFAAANSVAQEVETFDLPSKINPPKSNKLEVEIFDKIVKASPKNSAFTMDSQGNYPLHMACKSGYSWSRGLEDLVALAPEVARSSNQPNIFVLMAENVKIAEVKPKKQHGTRKLLRKLGRGSGKSKRKEPESEEELERLNTVFQLFQIDPSIALSLLR